MEEINNMAKNIPKINQNTEMSFEQLKQRQCDRANEVPGKLTGYDCPDCLNRGGSYVVSNGEIAYRQCGCDKARQSLKYIEQSGLADILNEHTFEAYTANEPWQASLKDNALNFIGDNYGKWFYAGGQVGSGKTHICTAIAGELLKSGKEVRYMLWLNDSIKMKSCVNNEDEYYKLLNPLKIVDVLYIDDFFKTSVNEKKQYVKPTGADIKLAFDLLNYRYINKSLITIISCEYFVDDLIEIDEAVGSRVYERTKEYCNNITRDINRNFRLKD